MSREPGRFVAFIRARHARATLMSLDDRMLADIGISRSEIDGAISGRIAR